MSYPQSYVGSRMMITLMVSNVMERKPRARAWK